MTSECESYGVSPDPEPAEGAEAKVGCFGVILGALVLLVLAILIKAIFWFLFQR